MTTIGRPEEYTPEIGDALCARISDGASLRTVCKADDMPCTTTFYRWRRLHTTFAEQYARATSERAEAMAEEIQDIADDGTNDWMEVHDPKTGALTGYKINGEHIQRSKLRVDVRKWLMAKMKPKRYGEKLDLSSSDGTMTPRPHTDFYAAPVEHDDEE